MSNGSSKKVYIINPQRMCEGYRTHCVFRIRENHKKVGYDLHLSQLTSKTTQKSVNYFVWYLVHV